MYKIGAIGSRDTVIGFKALGLETFPVDSPEDAKHVMRALIKAENEYAIIYLEETFAEALSSEINRVKEKAIPAVILIPGRDGSLGLGKAALAASVERAIGTNILGS